MPMPGAIAWPQPCMRACPPCAINNAWRCSRRGGRRGGPVAGGAGRGGSSALVVRQHNMRDENGV
jgi:hypothetical protein